MITTTGINNYNVQLAQRANEVVNQVFYGTLLREFRQAQTSTIFDKGPGGQTFIRQLDMELIKRISQGGRSPLTDALVKQLSATSANGLPQVNNQRPDLPSLSTPKISVFPENRGTFK